MSIARTIYESLDDPKLQKQVDAWPKGDYSFTDHIFGSKGHRIDSEKDHPNNHRITIPLVHEDPIKDHLENNGHTDVNYEKGTVKDSHGRETRIGKALVRTKAEPHLIKRFNDDSARKALGKSSDTHEVIISRHPYDVAGMSTGKRWNSCMDMKTGENAHYLPGEIRNGTHVAYLVAKGVKHGVSLHEPVARIALKKYKSEDSEHEILRPSDTYGAGGGAFEHTVRAFTEKHFPAKPEKYTLKSSSYNDGESDVYGGDHTHFEQAVHLLHHHNETQENGERTPYSLSKVTRAKEYILGTARNVDINKISEETHGKMDDLPGNFKLKAFSRLSVNPTANIERSHHYGSSIGNLNTFADRYGHVMGEKENFNKYVIPNIGSKGINEHKDVVPAVAHIANFSKDQVKAIWEHPGAKAPHKILMIAHHANHLEDKHIEEFKKSNAAQFISYGMEQNKSKKIFNSAFDTFHELHSEHPDLSTALLQVGYLGHKHYNNEFMTDEQRDKLKDTITSMKNNIPVSRHDSINYHLNMLENSRNSVKDKP